MKKNFKAAVTVAMLCFATTAAFVVSGCNKDTAMTENTREVALMTEGVFDDASDAVQITGSSVKDEQSGPVNVVDESTKAAVIGSTDAVKPSEDSQNSKPVTEKAGDARSANNTQGEKNNTPASSRSKETAATQATAATKPAVTTPKSGVCVHDWEVIYRTEHRDAVYTMLTVVERPAGDIPIEEMRCACNTCGALFKTGREAIAHADSTGTWYDIYQLPDGSYLSGPIRIGGCNGGWHSKYVTVGYKHVTEAGHYEKRCIGGSGDIDYADHGVCKKCGATATLSDLISFRVPFRDSIVRRADDSKVGTYEITGYWGYTDEELAAKGLK